MSLCGHYLVCVVYNQSNSVVPKERFKTEFTREIIPIIIVIVIIHWHFYESLRQSLPHLSLLFHKHTHIGVHTFPFLFRIVSFIWSPNLVTGLLSGLSCITLIFDVIKGILLLSMRPGHCFLIYYFSLSGTTHRFCLMFSLVFTSSSFLGVRLAQLV